MSNSQIPNLTPAISLNGTEQLEAVQSGSSVRITTYQIGTYISTLYPPPGISSVTANSPLTSTTALGAVTINLPTQSITNSYLAKMAANTVKANLSGSLAAPTDVSPSSILDTFGTQTGTLLVRSSTGWQALTSGTNAQVLTSTGTSSLPTWTSLSLGTMAYENSNSVSITGGAISGVSLSSCTINQTPIGASTPSTGAFTNLSASGTAALGTVSSGTWQGNPVAVNYGGTGANNATSARSNLGAAASGANSDITSLTGLTTPLSETQGGTGYGSYTTGDILYAASSSTLARLNDVATGNALISGGVGAVPSWGKIGLTTHVSGTLPVANGGTGITSFGTGVATAFGQNVTGSGGIVLATSPTLITPSLGTPSSITLTNATGLPLTTGVTGTLPVANGGTGATSLTGYLYGNGTSAFTASLTIPNAGLTNSSITIGSTAISLGATTSTLAGLTTVTLTQDPTAALQASTKQYVDNQVATVSNQTFHAASSYATTAALTANYANGTGGVGATLTNSGTLAALVIDGYTFLAADVTNSTRVLVKDQASGLQNGLYTVTNQGSGSVAWVLTRAADFNTVGTGPNYIETGASTFVTSGSANAASGWVMNTTGTITVGSTSLVWAQTSSSSSVTVTSPLTKVGSVISLGTVGVTFGGTGLTTLTQYSVMLGNGTGNVAFASPGTSGYALLSNGAGANPSFGQLSLTAGVTGTLPVANGGTGITSLGTGVQTALGAAVTGSGGIVLATSPTLVSPALGTPSAAVLTNATGLPLTSGVTGTLPVANGGTGTATAFTAGSVVFAGASGVYSQNNSKLFWDNTNNRLGINSATPQTQLTILSNTQTVTPTGTLPAGTDIYIVGANAANTRITQDAYGTGSYGVFTARSARGTAASPTASQSGDFLTQFTGRGYGATGFATASTGYLAISAAENFTDTAQGTYVSIFTTATGANSVTEAFRFGPAGQFGIGAGTYGTSGYVLTSGGASAAPTWSQVSATGLTGVLPVANGGTNISSYTIGDLIYASGTTTLSKLADIATGNALISGGVGVAPSYGKIGLTTHITGTLAVGNGGTGLATTPTNGQLLIGNGTNYTLATLTAGTNIAITNASGSISIATSATPTWTSETTPIIYGGTAASSSLTLQSTSGVGTSDSILFKVGNNGATTAMTVDTSGNVSIGTTVSYGKLLVYGDAVNFSPSADNTSNGIGACVYGTNVATATSSVAKLYLTGNNAAHAGTLDLRSGSVIGSTINMYNVAGTKTVYFNTDSASYINGGNVGIGTSSPGLLLDVNGIARVKSTLYFDTNVTEAIAGSATTNSLQFSTNNAERMRIDSSGNVGIGTSSPFYPLVVAKNQNTGTVVQIINANTGASATSILQLQAGVSNYVNFTVASNFSLLFGSGITTQYIDFDTQIFRNNAGAEYMRITSSGNVGIGTSSPGSNRLRVSLSDTSYNDGIYVQNIATGAGAWGRIGFSASSYYGFIGLDNSGNYYLQNTNNTATVFATNNTEAMRIDASGNVGIGTPTPVYKLDVNGIVNVQGALRAAGTGTNIGGASWSTLNTYYSLANSGNALISWNFSNGGGETDIIINRDGGGVGGLNIYDFPNASGAIKLLFQIKGDGTVPTLQYVTPQMYGAAGDGTTDDTTALTNALNSGYPVFLYGSFKITSAITITLSQGSGLKIEGAGQQKAEILLSGASTNLTIDIQYTGNYVGNNAQVVLRDFSLVAKTASSGTSVAGSPPVGMLNIIATPVPGGGFAGIAADNVLMENVSFLGDGVGWAYVGMYLQDLRYSTFRNINMQGCIGGTGGTGGASGSAGICFKTTNLSTVSNAPTGLYFQNIGISAGDHGIIFQASGYTGSSLAMDPQGVWIKDSIIIGQGTDSISFITTDQQSCELHIKDSTFYSYGTFCLYINNMGELRCTGNTISCNTNSSSVYCLYYTINASSSHNNFTPGQIMQNTLTGGGATVAIGGTVNKGTGIALSTVFVAFNSSTNCGGGVAGSAYTISGTAISASNNG